MTFTPCVANTAARGIPSFPSPATIMRSIIVHSRRNELMPFENSRTIENNGIFTGYKKVCGVGNLAKHHPEIHANQNTFGIFPVEGTEIDDSGSNLAVGPFIED